MQFRSISALYILLTVLFLGVFPQSIFCQNTPYVKNSAPTNSVVRMPLLTQDFQPQVNSIKIACLKSPKGKSGVSSKWFDAPMDSSALWSMYQYSEKDLIKLKSSQDTSIVEWQVMRDFFTGGNPALSDLRSLLRNSMENSSNDSVFVRAIEIKGSNFSNFYGWISVKPVVRRTEGSISMLVNLSPISLDPIAVKMSAIEIRTQAVKMNGDTTEMDATKFKTNPDATAEDLVTKMPGISSSGGQVQAQGEQVKKVLVDGKPFFGEDPNAALKNLPAEVISKIQVFDGKSDQSLFTGIDDGNTSKTINIVTKSQFRNGKFGRFYGGIGNHLGGSGDVVKYKNGGTFNSFKKARRITLLFQSNNINEQNFSFEDLVGAMGGGGGGRGGRGGGMMGGMMGGRMMGGSDFFVGNQAGINTTHAWGMNYSNSWGPKERWEVSGSYFTNISRNINESFSLRQYITGQSEGLLYEESNPASSSNINHRFNARITWNPDSINRILITPRISIQSNSKLTPIMATTTVGELNDILSLLTNTTNSDNDGINGGIGFNFRHAFLKKGRTFAVNANPGYSKQQGSTFINSVNTKYLPIPETLIFDQNNQTQRGNLNFSGSATFTESLDTNHSISINYQNNFNQNSNDRFTYLKDLAGSGLFNWLDTQLSSQFINDYSNHRAGLDYVYQTYKMNVTAGIRGQLAYLNGNQSFPYNSPISRTFTSLLPNIQGYYRLGMKKNLRFNYSTSNNAPSVDQLQPVLNNSNPLQLSLGNVSLKQDFNQSLFIRYFSVLPDKNRNFFALLSGSFTNNHISYKTIFSGRGDNNIALDPSFGSLKDSVVLVPGAQLSLPVNIDGYYSLRGFISWGRSFKKINFNTNAGSTVSRTPSLIQFGNGLELLNYAVNPTFTLGIVVSSNISEKLDFTLSSNTSYSLVKNTLQTALNQTYINQSSRFALNYIPKSKLVLSTDVTHQFYNGFSNGFNPQFFLWNAGIGYKFLKKNAGEFKLSMYDILNQNRSIQRNVTQTYFEDVRTTVLTRYILFTFTYKLSQFGGKGNNIPGMPPNGFPVPPNGIPMMPHGMPGR